MFNPLNLFAPSEEQETSSSLNKRGQMGGRGLVGGLVGSVIAVIIGVILIVNAAIPTVQDAVNSANVTGTTETVVDLIPLFLGIGALVLSTIMFRRLM